MKINNRIKIAMERKNIKPAELAKKLSVTPQSVYQWVRGDNAPKSSHFPELAKALDVTQSWLLGDDADIKNSIELKQDTEDSYQVMQEALEFTKMWLELPPDLRAALKSTAQAFIHSAQKQTDKVA